MSYDHNGLFGRVAIRAITLATCLFLAVALALGQDVVPISTDDSPANRTIRKALGDITSLEFLEAPLTDVVAFLRQKHDIEIQLDRKALSLASIAPETTQVTLNMKRISLQNALRLLLREYELTYVIRDEALLITSVTAAS